MSVMTVRNLDDTVKQKIQRRATNHGRSMEAQIRAILGSVPEVDPPGVAAAFAQFREAVRDLGPVQLPERVVGYAREVPFT